MSATDTSVAGLGHLVFVAVKNCQEGKQVMLVVTFGVQEALRILKKKGKSFLTVLTLFSVEAFEAVTLLAVDGLHTLSMDARVFFTSSCGES